MPERVTTRRPGRVPGRSPTGQTGDRTIHRDEILALFAEIGRGAPSPEQRGRLADWLARDALSNREILAAIPPEAAPATDVRSLLTDDEQVEFNRLLGLMRRSCPIPDDEGSE